MATSAEVLSMLIPNGGYIQYGEDFENIQFLECEPITKQQFDSGFSQYDAWKAEQDTAKATAKAAILNRIGLTAEELQTILG